MKYLLERTILFHPETNTLMLINDLNTEIKLSNQAVRLLNEMIANKDAILSREDLLNKVWDAYGFTASNNSLNVAISELRKAFSNLGVNPRIITTIHKTGFQFKADIDLIADTSEQEVIAEIAKPRPSSRLFKLKGNDFIITGLRKKTVITLLLLLLLFIAFALRAIALYIKDSSFQMEKVSYIYSFNKCDIYSLGVNKVHKEELVPVLSNEKINCDKDTDIFFKRTGQKNRVFKANFVGVCLRNNDKDYINCRSIKIFGE